jgi:hypothetical protein
MWSFANIFFRYSDWKAIRPEPPAASFLIIPQFSNARFPCHDQTKRSRSLKILTFTEPEAISQFYRILCLIMSDIVTPY